MTAIVSLAESVCSVARDAHFGLNRFRSRTRPRGDMGRRYVNIGSGVAGVSAAEAIRHHDPAGKVTVSGDDPHGYYSRPGLAYYLNRTIPERQLFPRKLEDLRHLFPNRVHGRVTALRPDNHQIVFQDGRRLEYDRLLIATGSRSTTPDFPGDDLAGIVKLDTLEDVRGILKLAGRGRPAVVVGGGIIAVELAEGLAARDMRVHYFLRGDRFWSSMLDETESRLVERGLEKAGIQLHYRTQVARAVDKRGSVAAVVTKGGETLPCQVLGTAVGVRPQMKLAQRAGLATDRGVLVNQYLETSAADVYAAGDVAQVSDPRTGGTWLETLWPTARRLGAVAGANMAGSRQECTRGVSYNTVRIGGIVTTTIGSVEDDLDEELLTVTANDGESWRQGPGTRVAVHAAETSRVRILVGERTIKGAVVMGDQSPARPLLQMIEDGTDVTPIRAALRACPARGVELVAEFYRKHYAGVAGSLEAHSFGLGAAPDACA